ncbi:gamma-glutamyltransferase [Allomyces macrogynus ATCC 38327]|uniref:Glutathione hydrolase n=1 Tax=Allomyces macrogynus (strain ATCC 38327) TaxID=578462 RepID=A0A0L0SIX0_ALLM3|nr:gamma-glutamyltransferase [Allomyces macrogynus ATCC 38327]|eukprot:KNE62451.1 gamma-glutamyltransferase [Allomyces macrogynus ATCC 38327]
MSPAADKHGDSAVRDHLLRDHHDHPHHAQAPNLPVLRARTRRRRALAACAALALGVTALVGVASLAVPRTRTATAPHAHADAPHVYAHAAVAAEVPECSTVGKNIMVQGGSAVDAAIATTLCVGSVHSFASGIGGGGFMLIRAPDGRADVVDFRETAPNAIAESLYAGLPSRAQIGGLAVGVPGEIRGFEVAHRKYGKLPWADVLAPIIRLNENGFSMTDTLYRRVKSNLAWIAEKPEWAEVFLQDNGEIIPVGEKVHRPALARTLRIVAEQGSAGFYEGEIAESLVAAAQRENGVLTLDDLRGYKAVVRDPVAIWYKGRRILSTPAPASGHVLLYMLNILERFSFKEGPVGVNYHRIVEALRYGFARRSELGDPDFLDIAGRLDEILTKQEAAMARRNISDSTTYPPEHYRPKYENAPSHGTTHVSVVDANDMGVAVTSTVNLIFGSHIMDRKTGVVLNDQMDDFSFRNFSNAFGLPPSPSNFVEPMKRPMSSTVPTIVEKDGRLELVVGGSGGSRILSAVLQTILNQIEFEWGVTRAVTAPRLHDQLYPNVCEVEDGFDPRSVQELAQRKHELKLLPVGRHESVVQAVARARDGALEAVSDYRKGGRPDGY